jgi:hypothetical protein
MRRKYSSLPARFSIELMQGRRNLKGHEDSPCCKDCGNLSHFKEIGSSSWFLIIRIWKSYEASFGNKDWQLERDKLVSLSYKWSQSLKYIKGMH